MNRRGTYRGIYSSLPDDPDFQYLSPHARLVFYTVRICKAAGPGVIFRYYSEVLCAQTGLDRKALDRALLELEAGKWIEREQVVVWVRNGLRYDPTVSLGYDRHLKAVRRSLDELPKLQIVLRFCDYYKLERPKWGLNVVLRVAPPTTDLPTTDLPTTDTDKPTPPTPPSGGARFEEFWKAYPRHEDRKGAEQEWQRLKVTPELLQIMLAAIEQQKRTEAWRDGKILYAVRWLKRHRWEDEPLLPGAGSQNGTAWQHPGLDLRTEEEKREADEKLEAYYREHIPQFLRPGS